MQTANLRIYACGGAGTNISLPFYKKEKREGYPNTNVSFLDFSTSNLTENVDIEQDTYIIKDVDGSGGDPKANYELVIKHLPQVLVKFQPGDFNIVVFSNTGGSGNPWGTMLLKTFAEKNIPAIGVIISSNESTRRKINGLNNLKTLDNIARKIEKSIVISYESNASGASQLEADASARATIDLLSLLVSREHIALDKADVLNWVYYNNITNQPPQLALMDILTAEDTLNKDLMSNYLNPISVASLYKSQTTEPYAFNADYDAVGYLKTAKENSVEALHFIIDTKQVPELYKAVDKEVRKAKEVSDARETQTALASKDDRSDENGFIF